MAQDRNPKGYGTGEPVKISINGQIQTATVWGKKLDFPVVKLQDGQEIEFSWPAVYRAIDEGATLKG